MLDKLSISIKYIAALYVINNKKQYYTYINDISQKNLWRMGASEDVEVIQLVI